MKRELKKLRMIHRTLADSYPYAFRIGQWLRLERPDWLREFERDRSEAAALPLRQAQDYAFVAFCEEAHAEELDELLVRRFFASAPEYLRLELRNTVNWYAEQMDPGEEARAAVARAHSS